MSDRLRQAAEALCKLPNVDNRVYWKDVANGIGELRAALAEPDAVQEACNLIQRLTLAAERAYHPDHSLFVEARDFLARHAVKKGE